MRLLRHLYYFFTKRFYTHQKASKAQNLTKQKPKNANKRTKIKNTLKKHLSRKNLLIPLFAKKKVSAIEMLVSLN